MDCLLSEMLLKEHSKTQRDKIVSYIGSNSKRFSELVQLMITGPYRITQRAAWALSYIVVKHPNIVLPHLVTLIEAASQCDAHHSTKQNAMWFGYSSLLTYRKNYTDTLSTFAFIS